MLEDFKAFLFKTNALALAIGVIIGGAFGKVVSSIVSDLLMPVVGLLIPGGTWRDFKIILRQNPGDALPTAITIGQFLGNLVDFTIIAACVFLLTKALIKPEPAPPPSPPTKTCPECLETIPQAAKRCRACASAV